MWKYREAIFFSLVLFTIGITLELLLPSIPMEQLKYPLNIVLGSGELLLILGLTLWGRKNKYVRWFSQVEMAVVSLCSMLLLVIIMGLTKQNPIPHDLPDNSSFSLGFSQMTRSWVFAIHFIFFQIILGLVTLRRLFDFRKRDIIFALNHLGLFIALFASVFGNGDIQRLRMRAMLNKPEWRAFDKFGKVHELPFSVKLLSFKIEEYPPKLVIVDNKTKKSLPLELPQGIVLKDSLAQGKLLDWDVKADNFLPFAVPLMGTDTEYYVSTQRKGATSAIYVKARQGDSLKQGWVSCGNAWFPYHLLKLDEQKSIGMAPLAPKQFVSKVIFKNKTRGEIKATIQVNKTVNIDGWKVYQVSYDEKMGRWSTSSVFEFVKDPWLPFVYIGIGLMLTGALSLFIFAKKPSSTNKN